MKFSGRARDGARGPTLQGSPRPVCTVQVVRTISYVGATLTMTRTSMTPAESVLVN